VEERDIVIEFDNVHFGYNNTEKILKGVSFKITQGDKVAIVGASGNGKSTIFNLICGFYEVNAGSLKIFEKEINTWNLAELRKKIAYVSQDVFLYPISIHDNILYGKLETAPDNIITAAKFANAHDFITEMPNGYQTIVGDSGVKLSGGQKQRIAIARAVLKDAPLILLDEPTSALDNQSEESVHEAIYGFSKEKTVLVIAHRLSTIKWADYILVVDEGKINGIGTHEELMESSTVYKSLYTRQLKVV
jgi:ABC-type multidrug transport system fused ATPase/permease subunit